MNGGLRPEAARQQVTVAYFWMMGLYSRDLSSTGSLPHVCWGHLDKIMTTVRGAGADDPEPHLAFCKSSTREVHTQWSPPDPHQVLWDLPVAAAPKPNRARVGAGWDSCLLAQPPWHRPSPGRAGRSLP